MQNRLAPCSKINIFSLCLLILLTMSCAFPLKKEIASTAPTTPDEAAMGHMSFILSNDISFPLGRYTIDDLSAQGKKRLQTIVEQIKAVKEKQPDNLEGKSMRIRLKVTAYTDAVGFRKGSDLIKTLSVAVKEMPPGKTAQRQLLNRELSKRRAYAIGDYIIQELYHLQSDQFEVDITPEYAGLGETPPPNVKPPLTVNAPRRRITIIDSYYTIESLE